MRCRAAIWIAALATLGVACQGPVRGVSVPEMDGQPEVPRFAGGVVNGPSAILVGASHAEVLRVAGEPAERRGEGKWVYAVRAFSKGGTVPAPALRIEFDAAGIVADWYFVNPRTDQRLAVRESLADARRFQSRFERPFCAGHLNMPGIEFDAVLRRRAGTREEVRRVLARHAAWPDAVRMRERQLASGLTWDYYVDRPSPLFMAPGYIVIEFGASGVTSISYQAPFGGCE